MTKPDGPPMGRPKDADRTGSIYTPLEVTPSSFGNLSPDLVMRKGRMGDAYVKSNKLTPEQVDEIVDLQNRLHIRFGEAAIRLGLLTEEDVREVLGKQFNYAAFAASGQLSKISRTLQIVHAPGGESAEAIKRLRSEVLVRLGQESAISVAVVSPLRGEGKSHIAASLALAFAQLNFKTMLIDADLRHPTQHRLFSLANRTGLSTMLAKRSAMTLEAVPEVMPGFWVLGSGPLPPNPSEILNAPKFSSLLAYFAPEISVFIVDTPSTLQWADAQTIALQTGRVLLIGRENATRLADLKKARNDMSGLGIQVLGTVYNRVPPAPLRWNWLTRVLRWFSRAKPDPFHGIKDEH